MSSETVIPGAEAFFFKKGKVGLVLSHGFTGTPKEVRELGGYLADKDISVIGPRLPGHGTTLDDLMTRTATDWYEEYKKAFLTLEKHCDEIFVGGLSMGGILSMRFASETKVKGLILMATPYKLATYQAISLAVVSPFFKKASIKKSKEGMAFARKYDNVCYSRDPLLPANHLRKFLAETRKQIHRIRTPTLILQGKLDAEWVRKSADKIKEKIGSKEKELVILEQSPHCLTIGPEKETVKKLVFEFIKKHSVAVV